MARTFTELAGKDNFEGITDLNYINKKGEPNGADAPFNDLPPGHDLFAQKNSDVAKTGNMKMKTLVNPEGFIPSAA
jgi:hypothetical protein